MGKRFSQHLDISISSLADNKELFSLSVHRQHVHKAATAFMEYYICPKMDLLYEDIVDWYIDVKEMSVGDGRIIINHRGSVFEKKNYTINNIQFSIPPGESRPEHYVYSVGLKKIISRAEFTPDVQKMPGVCLFNFTQVWLRKYNTFSLNQGIIERYLDEAISKVIKSEGKGADRKDIKRGLNKKVIEMAVKDGGDFDPLKFAFSGVDNLVGEYRSKKMIDHMRK